MNNKPIFVTLNTVGLLLAFNSSMLSQTSTQGSGGMDNLGSPAAGTAGTDHTFIGSGAGFSNTSFGVNNSFFGYKAGYSNTNQTDNVFVGYKAGYSNGSGDTEPKAMLNTFVGSTCGYSNTLGGNNTFTGFAAGYYNTTGDANSYFGTRAGLLGSTNNGNSIFGWEAGYNNTADDNSFFGEKAGRSNTSGTQNCLFGPFAGFANATGSYNTVMGYQAAYGSSGSSSSNSCFGFQSGYSVTTSGSNVFMGYRAGYGTTTGGTNVFIGYQAGNANTTGTANTILGYDADLGSNNLTNAAAIGANAIVKVSNDMILGDNSTDVGINLSNDATGPLSALSIGGPGSSLYETYSYNPSIGDGSVGIKGEIDATTSSSSSNKVYASVGYGNAYYGYTYGVYGAAYKTTAHSGGRAYGVYGVAGNCTNTYNYGVYGTLSGSNTGFAGYFDGLLRTTNDSPEKVTGGSWTGYSDERLKTNVQAFDDGLNVIRQINPVTYQFNGIGGLDASQTHIGVIAQDVREVAPYCIGTSQITVSQSDMGAFGDDVVMMLNDSTPEAVVNVMNYNYDGLIYAMINAIKELDSTVTALQAQVTQSSGLRQLQDSSNTPPAQAVALNNSRAVLYQNIPNPATDQTSINYYVSENATSAQMIFYDEFGREIKRVELEIKGNGSLDVNTVDLLSGVYSYSLIVDGVIIDTKQMVRTR